MDNIKALFDGDGSQAQLTIFYAICFIGFVKILLVLKNLNGFIIRNMLRPICCNSNKRFMQSYSKKGD